MKKWVSLVLAGALTLNIGMPVYAVETIAEQEVSQTVEQEADEIDLMNQAELNEALKSGAVELTPSEESMISMLALEDIVSIAKAEVGTSGVPNKYTYYLGAIAGSYSYAWCHAFVSWCAAQAGVTDLIPKTASCETGAFWFMERSMWRSSGSGYVPKAGDIIYFDWNDNGKGQYDHAGIVEYVSDGRVYTIEGNSSNAVSLRDYLLTEDAIVGYGIAEEVAQTCDCSESYQGTYIVNASSTGLNMRSGHGTSYEKIIVIPHGEQVTVSKANGLWAHVEYMGYSGYCSMEYLGKVQQMPYTDVVKGSWYYEYVQGMYNKGWMTGLNETTFGPEVVLSRAQFAVILHRMNDEPAVSYTGVYPDVVNGTWYTDAVLWARSAGTILGYENGYFGPADYITREQMALIMYRYAQYKGYSVSGKSDLSSYSDSAKVSSFAKEAMQWAVGQGIITGKDGKYLDPQGNANRAESATIIMRFYNKYGN